MNTGFVTDSGAERYLVKPGDLIYSKIRPALHKVYIAVGDWLCSADMYPVEVTTSEFAWEPFVRLMVDESMRVAMPKVNREKLAACPVLIPALSEQDAIAAFLDRETARIDALVEEGAADRAATRSPEAVQELAEDLDGPPELEASPLGALEELDFLRRSWRRRSRSFAPLRVLTPPSETHGPHDPPRDRHRQRFSAEDYATPYVMATRATPRPAWRQAACRATCDTAKRPDPLEAGPQRAAQGPGGTGRGFVKKSTCETPRDRRSGVLSRSQLRARKPGRTLRIQRGWRPEMSSKVCQR
jgi:Type I restriction modification DNA specificity domain